MKILEPTRGISLISLLCLFGAHGSIHASTQFYTYDIVAEVGSLGLTGIKSEVSINDRGNVVFIGQQEGGNSIWYWGGGTENAYSINPSFIGNNRDFAFPQINNGWLPSSETIVARDRVSGSPPQFLVRTWKLDGTASTVAFNRSGNPVTLPSINNRGDASYLELGTTGPTAATYLKQDQIPLATFSGNVSSRPMLSNSGAVIRAGNQPTDAIRVYGLVPSETRTIASSPSFSSLGRSPGISDDGDVVAFAGDRGYGDGIFVSYKISTGERVIARVAGENLRDAASSTPDLGFVVEETPEGKIDVPIFFESLDLDSRIGVVRYDLGLKNAAEGDSIVVCFAGTPHRDNATDGTPHPQNPFTEQPGIWTVQLDIDSQTHLSPAVRRAVPVAQVGDEISGGLAIRKR